MIDNGDLAHPRGHQRLRAWGDRGNEAALLLLISPRPKCLNGGNTATWARFSAIHCTQTRTSKTSADLRCTVKESQFVVADQTDSFWMVSMAQGRPSTVLR